MVGCAHHAHCETIFHSFVALLPPGTGPCCTWPFEKSDDGTAVPAPWSDRATPLRCVFVNTARVIARVGLDCCFRVLAFRAANNHPSALLFGQNGAVTIRNVFGRAETLELGLSYGSKTTSSYSAHFHKPLLWRDREAWGFRAFKENITYQLSASHDQVLVWCKPGGGREKRSKL